MGLIKVAFIMGFLAGIAAVYRITICGIEEATKAASSNIGSSIGWQIGSRIGLWSAEKLLHIPEAPGQGWAQLALHAAGNVGMNMLAAR